MKLPLKPLLTFSAVLVTSLLATSIINSPSASAAASTCTWDGGDVANNNMSDADNWDGCQGDHTVPTTGDTLVFPAGPTDKTITNDLTAGTSFAGITFSGTDYTLSGAAIALTGSIAQAGSTSNTVNLNMAFPSTITIDVATGSTLVLPGVISGSGGITKNGVGDLHLNGANTYDGVTTVNAGGARANNTQALGSTAGNTVVVAAGTLDLSQPGTYAENLVVSGTLHSGSSCTGLLALTGTLAMSGPDVIFGFGRSVTITGVMSGSGLIDFYAYVSTCDPVLTLTANNTYTGTITAAGNSVSEPIIVVEGVYSGSLAILQYATLKGNGAIDDLVMNGATAHVAPGSSPGCIATGDLSFGSLGGFYDVEIAGTTVCSQYDQVHVTGTVSLNAATTLNTSLLSSFAPAVGNTFTIIDNDGADAVTGTFSGLAEGATFKVGSTIFKISYVGGTGNDVVLTAMPAGTPITTPVGTGTSGPVDLTAAPAAPATGLGFIVANPLITLGVSALAALVLTMTARRLKLNQQSLTINQGNKPS